MANKLQEISKRLKQLDRQWDRMPEADRRSAKSDPLRTEMRKLRDEAEEVMAQPSLPEGFKYGFASPSEGTVRYAVHILPSTHIPVKAWGKIVKIDKNLKRNLAKYGVEFYGEFIQKIGAPPLVRYAGRRQFIVAKKGLEDKFNKWYGNGHKKSAKPESRQEVKLLAAPKKPWEMTRDEYFGSKRETGASQTARALFAKPYFQASPDKSYVIGERFKDFKGQTWQVVGQNDLHVPYIAKVVGGKVQKKQFVGGEGDMHKAGIVKALREGKNVPEPVLKEYPNLTKVAKPEPKAESKGKESDYYIHVWRGDQDTGGFEWEKIKGKRIVVPGYEDVDTFVHGKSGDWQVSEGKTGSSLRVYAKTIDEVIAETKKRLDEAGGKAKVTKVGEDLVEEHGISPRYGGAMVRSRPAHVSKVEIKPRYAELHLNRRGTAVNNPEDVGKFPPAKELSDADLLALVKTPAERATPAVKEYIAEAKKEFSKRNIRLKPMISAMPSSKAPTEPELKKVPAQIVKEAKERKEWAHRVLNDKDWMAKASTISKDAAAKYDSQTVQEIAKDMWSYLSYRGTAKDKVFGREVYIDEPAREKYLRLSKEREQPINDTWKLNRQQARNVLSSANMDLHRKAIEQALELGLKPYKGWQKDYPELVKPKAKPPKEKIAKPKPTTGIAQAVRDWLTGKAYIDNQGNYHVKAEGSSSGPVASWNKEAKARFKSPSELHQYATKDRARVGISAIDNIQAMRSSRAIAIDNALLAKRVVTIDNADVWRKNPNRVDIRGIDTPGSGRIRAGVAYADKGQKRLARKHHKGWRKIKFT